MQADQGLIEIFQNAAGRVPAYKQLLAAAKINPANIKSPEDFFSLPVVDKAQYFSRFPLHELCLDGAPGKLASVLTSSGHSGKFAFGLNPDAGYDSGVAWMDDALDMLYSVKSKTTLLINCLPMGVKVSTRACTLAETSVRPDMVLAVVKAFAGYFEQIIMVGDAAFMKHVLELGRECGIEWQKHVMHLISGEETLAENARRYLQHLTRKGSVYSSMGIGEVGLNIFFEAPPEIHLIKLRRLLLDDKDLRKKLLGDLDFVPSIFSYDPRRIFVEFLNGELLVTTRLPDTRIPLIRYATGDQGCFLVIPEEIKPQLKNHGIPPELFEQIPVVAILGRGKFAQAGKGKIYPEAVKEGIYHNAETASLTTANFRIISDAKCATIRVQLSPGLLPSKKTDEIFKSAISNYVTAPFSVACIRFEDFREGLAPDYERKWAYIAATNHN